MKTKMEYTLEGNMEVKLLRGLLKTLYKLNLSNIQQWTRLHATEWNDERYVLKFEERDEDEEATR